MQFLKSFWQILILTALFPNMVVAVSQDPNFQFSQRAGDLRVSWDEAECVSQKCKRFGYKKYAITVFDTYGVIFQEITDDLCMLLPSWLFQKPSRFKLEITYCGKRLNRNGKCKGIRKTRDFGAEAFGTLSELIGTEVPTTTKVQRIKNTAFTQCAYSWPTGAHTWGCWGDSNMEFSVESAGGYYTFQHMDTNQCLMPRSTAQNARLEFGECHSCKTVFMDHPDSQIKNEDSNRCMYATNADGAFIHQWTCYASGSDAKKWDFEDV